MKMIANRAPLAIFFLSVMLLFFPVPEIKAPMIQGMQDYR